MKEAIALAPRPILTLLPPRNRRMTVEEYLVFEEKSEVRHEFQNGKLTAMPGTTDYHNIITGLVWMYFFNAFRRKNWKVYHENVKVRYEAMKFTYPDVFITGDPRDHENRHIKSHPILIAEVASDGTREHDRTEKWEKYQQIESLQYYLLVEAGECLVEVFSRDENGGWSSAIFTDPTAVVDLPILEISMPLAEIYEE